MPLVSSSMNQSIVISDHAPSSFVLSLPTHHSSFKPWRLNPLLLADEEFIIYLTNEIKIYLELNDKHDISRSTLWEALKTLFSSYVKKQELSRLRDTSEAINKLDEQYAISPCPRLYKERISLQSEYNLLSTSHEEKRLLKTRHTFYEFGDKASKLLAFQSHQLNNSKTRTHIKAPSGFMAYTLQDINKNFVHFYSTLYTSEYPNDPAILGSFLKKKIDLPIINLNLNSDLGRPVVVSEAAEAIAAMQSSKAPGLDGFPIEFYKKFATLLGPLLVAVYNESFHTGTLPLTLTQASILLLPKEGKDPTLCESYRLISLLNVDFKIVSKIIALCLEPILPTIISNDQTGLIRGCNPFNNLRSLYNIMYTNSPPGEHEAKISLDAEKAFE